MDLDKMLRVDRCRDMDKLIITFEPDPDYIPDAGIRYRMRCNAEFYYVGKIPHNAYWRGRLLQRSVVLKRIYSPRAVGKPLSEVRALYRVPSSSMSILLHRFWLVIDRRTAPRMPKRQNAAILCLLFILRGTL